MLQGSAERRRDTPGGGTPAGTATLTGVTGNLGEQFSYEYTVASPG